MTGRKTPGRSAPDPLTEKMKNLFQHKINFTEHFKRLHSLRFHMSLILMATVCSGFLATRILLALHLENVMLRYPLAVIFAYLVFFISVKLWLKYISSSSPTTQKVHNNSLDLGDVLPDLPISCPSDGYPVHLRLTAFYSFLYS